MMGCCGCLSQCRLAHPRHPSRRTAMWHYIQSTLCGGRTSQSHQSAIKCHRQPQRPSPTCFSNAFVVLVDETDPTQLTSESPTEREIREFSVLATSSATEIAEDVDKTRNSRISAERLERDERLDSPVSLPDDDAQILAAGDLTPPKIGKQIDCISHQLGDIASINGEDRLASGDVGPLSAEFGATSNDAILLPDNVTEKVMTSEMDDGLSRRPQALTDSSGVELPNFVLSSDESVIAQNVNIRTEHGYKQKRIPARVPFLDGGLIRYVQRRGHFVLLGRGTHAAVFLGRWTSSHIDSRQFVAIKLMTISTPVDNTIFEASIFCHLNDTGATPECFGYVELFPHRRYASVAIVSSFLGDDVTYDTMTLSDYLHEQRRVSSGEIIRVFAWATHLLERIHEKRVIMNDIKGGNIMMVHSPICGWRPYFIDTGNAVFESDYSGLRVPEQEREQYHQVYQQVAPECVNEERCIPASDVFSLGRILQETGRFYRIPELTLVGDHCTQFDPDMRPTTTELGLYLVDLLR